MSRILAMILLAASSMGQSQTPQIPLVSNPPIIPIIGYQVNFPNGMQCAMVVAPPDNEIDKMPTYIIWAGRGDREIATRQTVFRSAYEATGYAEEHCRGTPRWAKEWR